MTIDKSQFEPGTAEWMELAFSPSLEPVEVAMENILIAVDRKGEGLILDADEGFYQHDVLTELFACDNGIDIPRGTKPGIYRLENCGIYGEPEYDVTIKGTLVPLWVS